MHNQQLKMYIHCVFLFSSTVVGRCIPSIFKSSLEKLTTKHNFVIKQKNGKEVTLSGLDKSSK